MAIYARSKKILACSNHIFPVTAGHVNNRNPGKCISAIYLRTILILCTKHVVMNYYLSYFSALPQNGVEND